MSGTGDLQIQAATIDDVALLRQFIAELADYEKLRHQVVVDDQALREHLFGAQPSAEALLGFAGEEPAAAIRFYENLGATVLRIGACAASPARR